MYKTICFLVVFLFIAAQALAASTVTFTWDANTEADLAGYRLYQSAQSGVYADSPVLEITTGESATIENVPDGTYFWVLTAFDLSGNESGYSNEVTAKLDSTAPPAPSNFKITVIIQVR